MHEQRRDMESFASGIRAWLVGDQSLEAEAAGMNVAEILVMHAKSLSDNKWDK